MHDFTRDYAADPQSRPVRPRIARRSPNNPHKFVIPTDCDVAHNRMHIWRDPASATRFQRKVGHIRECKKQAWERADD